MSERRVFFAATPGWYRLDLAVKGCARVESVVSWVDSPVGLRVPVMHAGIFHFLSAIYTAPAPGTKKLAGPRKVDDLGTMAYVIESKE